MHVLLATVVGVQVHVGKGRAVGDFGQRTVYIETPGTTGHFGALAMDDTNDWVHVRSLPPLTTYVNLWYGDATMNKDQTDQAFEDIADATMATEANDLLEKHISRTVDWVARQRAMGEPVTLRSLIKQLHSEPNQKGPVMAAYGTALWRILEQRGIV